MIDLTDKDLLGRLSNPEDPYVERKVEGDLRDCVRTAVAFANTLPNGVPGVIFIPAFGDGTVKTGPDLDRLQRSISERLNEAYPPLPYFQRVLNTGSAEVIAVLVFGSPQRPHFASKSYIRDGSQTKVASEEQFQLLIARRTSIVEELLKWVGKPVSMTKLAHPNVTVRVENRYDATLESVNQWYATLTFQNTRESFALDRLQLSFDHRMNRIDIEISY